MRYIPEQLTGTQMYFVGLVLVAIGLGFDERSLAVTLKVLGWGLLAAGGIRAYLGWVEKL